jgi:hypothetical protein
LLTDLSAFDIHDLHMLLLPFFVQHWGCFHPLRDISAAPYWLGQAKVAAASYGLQGAKPSFDVTAIPSERLLFFAGEA